MKDFLVTYRKLEEFIRENIDFEEVYKQNEIVEELAKELIMSHKDYINKLNSFAQGVSFARSNGLNYDLFLPLRVNVIFDFLQKSKYILSKTMLLTQLSTKILVNKLEEDGVFRTFFRKQWKKNVLDFRKSNITACDDMLEIVLLTQQLEQETGFELDMSSYMFLSKQKFLSHIEMDMFEDERYTLALDLIFNEAVLAFNNENMRKGTHTEARHTGAHFVEFVVNKFLKDYMSKYLVPSFMQEVLIILIALAKYRRQHDIYLITLPANERKFTELDFSPIIQLYISDLREKEKKGA